MKRNIFKKTAMALVLGLSLCSQAILAADSPVMKITEIKTWGSMDLLIIKTSYQGTETISSSCNKTTWQVIADDPEANKRMFSMLLAAYTADLDVRFWYDADDCGSLSNAQKTGVMRLVK